MLLSLALACLDSSAVVLVRADVISQTDELGAITYQAAYEAEDWTPNANTATKSWTTDVVGTANRAFTYEGQNFSVSGWVCELFGGALVVDRTYNFFRRMGPLAVDGSTGLFFWVIVILPLATRRRAAQRTRSIISRQSFGNSRLAASLGQMLAVGGRWLSNSKIATSRLWSRFSKRCCRQVFEQYLISSQQSLHLRRHSIRRPQLAQSLVCSWRSDIFRFVH